jgi:hypothetical protein
MVHVTAGRRLAAAVLVVVAACSGGGGNGGDGAAETTVRHSAPTTPTTARPGTFDDCAGPRVDLTSLGVSPGRPKAVARTFATAVLHWDDAREVPPRRACEVRLRSARAGATAWITVAGAGEAFVVDRASTAEDTGDGPALSVALIAGHVEVHSGLLCGECTSGRFMVVYDGGQASVPVRPTGPVDVELDISPTAVRRALVILLADAAGVVRAAELVSVPDGDFAAS